LRLEVQQARKNEAGGWGKRMVIESIISRGKYFLRLNSPL